MGKLYKLLKLRLLILMEPVELKFINKLLMYEDKKNKFI